MNQIVVNCVREWSCGRNSYCTYNCPLLKSRFTAQTRDEFLSESKQEFLIQPTEAITDLTVLNLFTRFGITQLEQ